MTSESGKTYIDRLKQVPAVMLLAVGGAALAGCGAAAEQPRAESSSVEADQTAEHVSTDTQDEVIMPEASKYPPLDQVAEGEWTNDVNLGLLAQISSWLELQAKNPGAEVPVDSFTSTPDSTVMAQLREFSAATISAKPEDSTFLYTGVYDIATDFAGGPTKDVTEFSDLSRDPSKYPGSSYIKVFYEWEKEGDDAHDRSDRVIVKIPLDDQYSIEQTDSGVILLN